MFPQRVCELMYTIPGPAAARNAATANNGGVAVVPLSARALDSCSRRGLLAYLSGQAVKMDGLATEYGIGKCC